MMKCRIRPPNVECYRNRLILERKVGIYMKKNNKKYRQILPGLMVEDIPLMTSEIEKKLKNVSLSSYKGSLMEANVVTAYYTPFAKGRWVIIAGEKLKNGDWELFGYMHLLCWEWGSIYLSELQRMLDNGTYIERDLHCADKKVKDLLY